MRGNKYYGELNDYERKIKENVEKFKSVENVERWKKIVEKAAENTLRKRKTLVFESKSQESKEKAINVLRENIGKILWFGFLGKRPVNCTLLQQNLIRGENASYRFDK